MYYEIMRLCLIILLSFPLSAHAFEVKKSQSSIVYNECVNSMKSATSPARKKNMTLSNCLKQSKTSQTVYSGSNTAAFNKFIIFNPVGAAYVLIRDVVTKEVTKY